jgi:hypothetical protein
MVAPHQNHLLRFSVCLISTLFWSSPIFAARPTAARLLPESTVAMVSVPDAKVFAEKFMNTNLGRMLKDPQMQPVVEQLYGSFGELIEKAKGEIGLSLAEMIALPQGEITLAMVVPPDSTPGGVLIFDAGDQIANARKLIDRVKAAIDSVNKNKSEQSIGDVKCTVYQSQNPSEPENTLVFFEKDSAIAFCVNIEAAKQVLDLWNEKKDARSLAENANYAAIASRCRGSKDEEPQLIGYVDPVGIVKAVAQKDTGAKIALAMFPAFGMDGLGGVGGSVIFDTVQYDAMMHLHVLLSSPRTGVFKAIAFEPGSSKPEHWVPNDVVSYTTMNWNFPNSFEAIGTLFDSIRGEGAFVQSNRNIAQSTGIDPLKHLVPALDGRVTYINWIEKPVTVSSSAVLVGFKLKSKDQDKENNVESVGTLLDNFVKKIPDRFDTKTVAGKSYYYVRMPEMPKLPDGREPPPMPKPCFGIMEDYLMIANQTSIYEQVLATAADNSKSLADELDYKLIAGKLQRLSGGAKPAMLSFDRPEESLRYMYDLVQNGGVKNLMPWQLRSQENPLMKTMNSALEKQPLPPFSVIQKYLSSGGGLVIDDETGIHFMSFSLKRKD